MTEQRKHNHYYKNVKHLDVIDIYRFLKLYQVDDHCLGQAIKKIVAAGRRGAKGPKQDIQEAIDLLLRYLEIRGEDEAAVTPTEIKATYNPLTQTGPLTPGSFVMKGPDE